MSWCYLLLAGAFEIVWALALKHSQGFTRATPTLVLIGAMAVSVGLLGLATKTLPIGTAYAIWTGIGTLGTAIVGIVWLGDAATVGRMVAMGLIVAGTLGLKLA